MEYVQLFANRLQSSVQFSVNESVNKLREDSGILKKSNIKNSLIFKSRICIWKVICYVRSQRLDIFVWKKRNMELHVQCAFEYRWMKNVLNK